MQIYLIKNKITGQCYVGQTRWDFNTRYAGGKWYNYTHSKYLKNAAKKTGEIISVKKKEISLTCKKINIKRENLLNLLAEKSKVTGEWKLKTTDLGRRNIYIDVKLYDKNDNPVIIKNVFAFCEKNGFSRGAFYKLLKGKSTNAYGYTLRGKESARVDFLNRFGMSIKLKNIKTNEIINVENISEFCRQNNLNVNVTHSMIRNTIKQYNFWTLPNRDLSGYRFPKKIVYIKMKNSSGLEVYDVNPKRICKKVELSSDTIYGMTDGRRKNLTESGWRVINVKYLNDYYPEVVFA